MPDHRHSYPACPALTCKRSLRPSDVEYRFIFITAHGETEMRIHAMREGAVEFLSKPFHDEVLLQAVNAALDRRRNA